MTNSNNDSIHCRRIATNNNSRLKNWRTRLTAQFASQIVGVWYSDVGMRYVKIVHLGLTFVLYAEARLRIASLFTDVFLTKIEITVARSHIGGNPRSFAVSQYTTLGYRFLLHLDNTRLISRWYLKYKMFARGKLANYKHQQFVNIIFHISYYITSISIML